MEMSAPVAKAARRGFESTHLHQLPAVFGRSILCRADHELFRLVILCFRIETDISCFRFESLRARPTLCRKDLGVAVPVSLCWISEIRLLVLAHGCVIRLDDFH